MSDVVIGGVRPWAFVVGRCFKETWCRSSEMVSKSLGAAPVFLGAGSTGRGHGTVTRWMTEVGHTSNRVLISFEWRVGSGSVLVGSGSGGSGSGGSDSGGSLFCALLLLLPLQWRSIQKLQPERSQQKI